MKYIIDIPDEVIEFMGGRINVFVEPECKAGDCKHYALRISKRDITPYTVPDREAIENEVWRIARLIALEYDDGGLTPAELYRCFGNSSIQDVMKTHSYQEAKARYDAWKKSKDEIRVGDEVKYIKEYGKFVTVTVINSYGCCFNAIDSEGNVYHDMTTKNWVKTGRHFDVVDELLKKMKEKSE